MKEPIINFTMVEALDHYKNNPAVKCLASEKTMMLNSATIHSEKYPEHPDHWIWGFNFSGQNVLLYAPSKFLPKFVKAEIINMD